MCFLMILHCCLHHPHAVWGPLNSLQGSESCCWTGPQLDLLHPSSLVNTDVGLLQRCCIKMCHVSTNCLHCVYWTPINTINTIGCRVSTSCVYWGIRMSPLPEETTPFRPPFNTSYITLLTHFSHFSLERKCFYCR